MILSKCTVCDSKNQDLLSLVQMKNRTVLSCLKLKQF